MKTYEFEKTVYYSDNYNFCIELPDDVVFCEYMNYSKNQRFYFSIIKNPSNEMIDLFKKSYHKTKLLGNLLIGILNNVKPLCDIPEITIDDANNLYSQDFRKMYIVTKCENKNYMMYHNKLIRMSICKDFEEAKNIFDTDEAKELINKLKSIEPFYIESISRPIKFVYGGTNGPSLLCDFVQFYSWLDPDIVINQFQKTDIDITKWDLSYIGESEKSSTVYMGDAAEPWKEMFINRLNEITKTAYE